MAEITLKDNTYYRCENGAMVLVKQFAKSLVYKFRAISVSEVDSCFMYAGEQEVWNSRGEAIHYDCGWSIIEELGEA